MSTSALKPIIFYDIPSVVPGQPWSPNTMRTRYCLTFKGLPFETVWVEFPEIRPFYEENSLVPTVEVVVNGTTQPVHTLPVIMDPNTNRFVPESFAIAEYLDEQYPDTPKVLPHGTTALIHVFHTVLYTATRGMGQGLTIFRGAEKLNPVSKEFYTRTRTERSGVPWEQFATPEKREQQLNNLCAMCDTVDGWYAKSSGQFILGDVPCFADFIVAGRFKWMQYSFEEQEWEEVMSWNGGRWGKLIEATDKYFSF